MTLSVAEILARKTPKLKKLNVIFYTTYKLLKSFLKLFKEGCTRLARLKYDIFTEQTEAATRGVL